MRSAAGDDFIEKAQGMTERGKRREHIRKKWGAAVCICLIVLGGIVLLSPFGGEDDSAEGDSVQEQLLAAVREPDSLTVNAAIERYIPLEGRLACYDQIYVGKAALTVTPESPESTERLTPFVGTEYLKHEDQIWYRVNGMDELKYLISKDGTGALRLWEFKGFYVLETELEQLERDGVSRDELSEAEKLVQKEYPGTDLSPYTYGDVYRLIYHVEGADEIAGVTAAPSNSNNSDEGIAIQKKVGTHEYTDRKTIARFYDCTASVVCRGTVSDWDSIGRDRDKYTYSFSTDAKDKLTSGEETWATRWLTVTLTSGTTIDSWKYQALNGQFYEFGGISTEPLDEERVYELNEMFDIR